MSFVAVAIGGSALLGVGGAAISASAAGKAASQQQQASTNALDFEEGAFGTVQSAEAPYEAAGTSALGTLQNDLPSLTAGFDPTAAGLPSNFSFDGSKLSQTPGYQFALAQGNNSVMNSAAARGGDASGAALEALDSFNVGEADQNYNNVYAQQQGTYNSNYSDAYNTYESNQANAFSRLASLVGVGQTATGQVANAAQNYGNNAASIATGAGNAAAAGTVGAANAFSSGLSGAGSTVTNGLLLQQLLNSSGSGGSGITPNVQTGAYNYSNNNSANLQLDNSGYAPLVTPAGTQGTQFATGW
jgi:hypothetical protein